MIRFSEIALLRRFPFQDSMPLMVDVGAHAGGSCLPFAAAGWRVLAFEPEVANRTMFLRNSREFPNVECLDVAVSNEVAMEQPFFVSSEHYGIHSLKRFHPTHEAGQTVDTVRLDDVLDKRDIAHVTFLKIDIEGADFLALQGFSVERFGPEVVMLEFMDARSRPNFAYDHHDVARFMEERGYACWVSEWAPIVEYGRAGEPESSHRWLHCVPYPLDHEPAWGNLIFVPEARRVDLEQTLAVYRAELARSNGFLRSTARKIPGARALYRTLRRWTDA